MPASSKYWKQWIGHQPHCRQCFTLSVLDRAHGERMCEQGKKIQADLLVEWDREGEALAKIGRKDDKKADAVQG